MMIVSAIMLGVSSLTLPSLPPPIPVEVRSELFPALPGDGMALACASLDSGVTLFGPNDFGGISGIEFRDDQAFLMSDAAGIFRARPIRGDNEWIIGFSDVQGGKLHDENGREMSKSNADSEGILLDGPSHALISFENENRIDRYTIHAGGWQVEGRVFASTLNVLGRNSGFEGITRLSDGRLIVISEGTYKNHQAAVFTQNSATLDSEGWSERRYTPADKFRVTDLATDSASGDVFVLERAYSRVKGPRARLVRVSNEDALSADLLSGKELARLNFFHGVDNMEGLALERRDDGTLRAHLVSDDNFSDRQRTVLLGLSISEDAECLPSAPTEIGQGRDPAPQ